jgi:hypothetical protein
MRNKADIDHAFDWLAMALKADHWEGMRIWPEE